MSAIAPAKCPQCGAAVPEGSPGRVCPRCAAALLKAAPTEITENTRNAARPFTPPPVADLAPLFPQLEILELIGQGGMGAVYKARQKELDRIIALKILPPGFGDAAFAERFAREAKALARLNHPGIVTLYEFGCSNGLFFFLMEFVDGATLRQVLQAGRISPREALAIVPEICDALQYAHDQGIVHRDIKPDNILLDRRGHTKVADFGLAKLIATDSTASEFATSAPAASSTTTHSGKVLGTPHYMAPEQVDHPAAVDHRADIYALGVVFYQMLTGELPGQRLEPPSKKVRLDVRLDEVVLRALEKNPALRYAQADTLKQDIETIAMTEAPSGGAPPRSRQPDVAEKGNLQKLARLLLAPAADSPRRAARIQSMEKNIILPVRAVVIAILGFYFFLNGWSDLPGAARGVAHRWLTHYLWYYLAANLLAGAAFIWVRSLSWRSTQQIIFSIGLLDVILLLGLAFIMDGFDSNVYWVFLVLILHNALAIPLALPQILLNLLALAGFITAGILDQRLIVFKDAAWETRTEMAVFNDRVIVLVVWAACCYGIQLLLERQRILEAKATSLPPRSLS